MLTELKNAFRSSYLFLAAPEVGPFSLRGQSSTSPAAAQREIGAS